MASPCLKFIDTKPKCTKCEGGHKTENCGLKCSFCFGLGHMENQCWKKFVKGLNAITNFLEVLVNDEEATLVKLNQIYGNQHMFSRIRMPKKKLHLAFGQVEVLEKGVREGHKEMNLGNEASIKSKILSHFIKGKISLTPMETILIILRELEYLEGLVKLTRRKDVENHQVATIHQPPIIRRVNVNRTHYSKTLHLAIEIN
jgi:hypothetical protein